MVFFLKRTCKNNSPVPPPLPAPTEQSQATGRMAARKAVRANYKSALGIVCFGQGLPQELAREAEGLAAGLPPLPKDPKLQGCHRRGRENSSPLYPRLNGGERGHWVAQR